MGGKKRKVKKGKRISCFKKIVGNLKDFSKKVSYLIFLGYE